MERKTDFVEDHDIVKLAKQIAKERVAPKALERDQNRTFPWDGIRTLGEADLLGVIVCDDHGGIGGGRASFGSVVGEISRACASTALVYVSHAIVAKAIELGAGEPLKDKWLPEMLKGRSLGAFAVHEPDCGSNAGAVTTPARKDGGNYIVNGSKFFITSAGEANLYLALVRTDPEKGPQGMSTLVIERILPAFRLVFPKTKWAWQALPQGRCSSTIAGFLPET